MLRCLIAIVVLSCNLQTLAAETSGQKNPLLSAVDQYVDGIKPDIDQLPADRRAVLDSFAAEILLSIQRDGICKLNFICTHNSRRSHLSQVWAQTAAQHYGIDSVETFSGGTAATACNARTIAALQRAGFSVDQLTAGQNPHYLIRYSDQADPLTAFSKVYSDTKAGNPDRSFIAVMCCSQADRQCPIIHGASARIPLHYDDPKVADNTPAEAKQYDERCRQIAIEMFYVMNQVAQRARQ